MQSKSRIAAVGALAGSAVLLFAGPASAHVSVEPGEAEKGGYTKLVFKVPNERDDAGTTKVEVNLPADHPVSSVQTTPVPGWKVKVTKSKLDKPLEVHGKQVTEAVTKVTWSGGTIEPGNFMEFPISVGPLPEDTDTMVFKALQTYEGGEVVRWIEEPKADGSEVENPAPVLALAEASEDGHGGGADDDDKAGGEQASTEDEDTDADAGGADSDGGQTESAADSSSSDGTARTLGIAGIVIGVLGTGVGVFGLRRAGGTDGGTGTPSA